MLLLLRNTINYLNVWLTDNFSGTESDWNVSELSVWLVPFSLAIIHRHIIDVVGGPGEMGRLRDRESTCLRRR